MIFIRQLVLVFSLSFACLSGAKSTNNFQSFQFDSSALKETRQIQVYLPPSYFKEEMSYPVLYVLDGQRLFHHAVSLLQSFKHFDQTPEFIVVGIENVYPDRFSWFYGKEVPYAQFITQEIRNKISADYRTNKENILFGWEYAGGFALNTFTNNNGSFDTYIMASPYPIGAPNIKVRSERYHELSAKLKEKGKTLKGKLFYTVSDNESDVNDGTRALTQLLEQAKLPTDQWQYKHLSAEEHRSTPFSSLYHGLKFHFNNYEALNFIQIKEFYDFGGFDAIENHYKAREARYGNSDKAKQETRWSIATRAMFSDDFALFKQVFQRYENEGFITNNRASWLYRFGEYFLKNKDSAFAIKTLTEAIKQQPNSAKTQFLLAKSYVGNKQLTKAKHHLDKAKTLAKNDKALTEEIENFSTL